MSLSDQVASQAYLRSVDRELLRALRQCMQPSCGCGREHGVEDAHGDSASIGQLTECLGVTATAVRQRIERLLQQGLIDREKVVEGRGRPTFRYRLTVEGYRRSGADPTELADAMWREILALPDEVVRQQLIGSIAQRLGRQFAAKIDPNDSFNQRVAKLSTLLAQRQVQHRLTIREKTPEYTSPTSGANANGESLPGENTVELPVLDIGSCPYPSLTDASGDRSMCRMEEEIFSRALGTPVELSRCRLDGDDCCQFSAVATRENLPRESKPAEKTS
ncbi:helix-turn-helix transcriptional regulator [Stieleria varia]|uniref:HTH marR-type domain-containing protein n=1 Tax=Stieleria varia TaxID=2528005 RepID=A0A5C6B2Y4_9BACT|nr:MarR family transcriptional regulator [Stieleria varia]TWU05606.1 hypothetical protein Pla52n_13210 [Stieleria varia]